jgi:hypothetical protein
MKKLVIYNNQGEVRLGRTLRALASLSGFKATQVAHSTLLLPSGWLPTSALRHSHRLQLWLSVNKEERESQTPTHADGSNSVFVVLHPLLLSQRRRKRWNRTKPTELLDAALGEGAKAQAKRGKQTN